MPPQPKPGETEEQYMEGCIPFVLDDGSAEDHPQAVAMCASMWDNREKGGSNAMEHKTFAFELTNLDAEGRTIEGYASAFGNVDGGGDIVHPGAFTKTLKERGDKVKFLWQHNQDEPLGPVLQMHEDSRGLFVKAKVSATTRGNDALELLRDKALDGLSIGYDAVKGGTDYSDGNRNLREVKLYEFSLVTFPMNESAGVTAIKAAVMKTESDGKHPASHYLVVEDPQEVSTWHLRVYDVGGELDHRLMGAAWAALHKGHRGNVYEGPGKAEAIAKLRKLYAREDMDVPDEKSAEPQEEKIGRAISAARAGRISDAVMTLVEVLESAGIPVDGFGDEPPEPPDKHNALAADQTLPAASKIEAETPPVNGDVDRPDTLTLKLQQIEIGLQQNKLLEVTQ